MEDMEATAIQKFGALNNIIISAAEKARKTFRLLLNVFFDIRIKDMAKNKPPTFMVIPNIYTNRLLK